MTTHSIGDVVEVQVGAPAHGGFCIARLVPVRGDSLGRVCFVRHALPGELVRAAVTEDRGGGFFRADAIEILRPSADRVLAPCPHAGPGKCGGCDWQHASGPAQRRLKEDVVREQFRRLAKVELPDSFTVEALDDALLGWRTRVTYAVSGDGGSVGLHRHRLHQIEPIDACPLGVAGVGDSDVLAQRWPGVTGVQVVLDSRGERAIVAHRPGVGRQARGRRPPDRTQVVDGPERLTFEVRGRSFAGHPDGFWQVHPQAPRTFAEVLLASLALQPGQSVLDLYAGVGALTAALAEAVGPTGRVWGVESSSQAVRDAAENLADLPWADVERGRLDPSSVGRLFEDLPLRPDAVVLDPPRSGAGREIMAAILALHPRAIGYVACDPAALARDAAVAFEAGWTLTQIRGFDAFPMTHHLECIAIFTRD